MPGLQPTDDVFTTTSVTAFIPEERFWLVQHAHSLRRHLTGDSTRVYEASLDVAHAILDEDGTFKDYLRPLLDKAYEIDREAVPSLRIDYKVDAAQKFITAFRRL